MLFVDLYKDKYYVVASLNGSLFIRTFLEVMANKANDVFHSLPKNRSSSNLSNVENKICIRYDAFESLNKSYPLCDFMERKLLLTKDNLIFCRQKKEHLFRLYLIFYPVLLYY